MGLSSGLKTAIPRGNGKTIEMVQGADGVYVAAQAPLALPAPKVTPFIPTVFVPPPPTVAPYGSYSATSGFQAHHLNQDAAFNALIPKNQGVATILKGNAFTEPGTPHYLVHQSTERFWDQYRRGGALFGTTPTNADYVAGVRQAFLDAGYDPWTATRMAEAARRDLSAAGLVGTAPVPRIPRKIYQVRPQP